MAAARELRKEGQQVNGVDDLVRAINSARSAGLSGASFEAAQAKLRELTGVLGLTLELPATAVADGGAEPFIAILVDLRTQLRAAKQWALADQVRNQLAEHGVTLEDTPNGTTWKWG